MVSTHWQKTILEAPILWTYLVLEDSSEDEAAKLETFLQMSLNLPLDVEIIMSQNTFRPSKSLDLCKSRIKSLVFSPRHSITKEKYEKIVLSLLRNGPYPLVTNLCLGKSISVRVINKALPLMCPQLQFLQGARISFRIKSSPVLPLESYVLPVLHISVENSNKVQAQHIERNHAQFFKPVINTTSCTRELELLCAFNLIPVLLTYIAPLSNLHSLHLNLGSNWPFESPSLGFPVLTHLRSFSLTFRIPIGPESFQRFISQITINDPLINLNEFRLLTMEPQIVVDVEQLNTLLTQIRNVESLALETSLRFPISSREEDKQEREPIHMGRLLKLSLAHSTLLKFLNAPKLRHLDILRTHYLNEFTLLPLVGFGQNLSSLTVPSTHLDEVCLSLSSARITQYFPVLASVHLIDWGVCRTLVRLTSLVSVSFHGKLATQGFRKSINHFLHDLILYPNNLPHLQELSFGVFPQWELLFHAIHSRFLKNVVPLNRITFPFNPVRVILRALVQCLQGQPKSKLARHVDSIISKRLPLFRDPCSACLSAGRENCHQYSAQSAAPTEESRLDIPIGLLVTGSPDSTDEGPILGYWTQLLDLDNDIWKRRVIVYEWCRRYHVGSSVNITQYTTLL
ncbi:hypothetical protein M408DRAFT_332291 [Serendipita vermifera MAFF 305830]|uniref:Uncharacterized protein n=1 Tax=Serendipita vermifera MAFF 305830 TaxID=933852 RepID=A0A0C3AWD6_SERVB|nr:hypothetical protein M408DRAFT_332291 [Serendipita vermifera MAFF 305830]